LSETWQYCSVTETELFVENRNVYEIYASDKYINNIITIK